MSGRVLIGTAHAIDLHRLVVGKQSLAEAMDEETVAVDGPSAAASSLRDSAPARRSPS